MGAVVSQVYKVVKATNGELITLAEFKTLNEASDYIIKNYTTSVDAVFVVFVGCKY